TIYESEYISHTKKTIKNKNDKLVISGEYLNKNDNIIIIDDFLASGNTIISLLNICKQANCNVIALGFIIEKEFENGRINIKNLYNKNNIYKNLIIKSSIIINQMDSKINGDVSFS